MVAIKAGELGLDPFEPELLQPSSIDVRLDRLFRVFNNHLYTHIDPSVQQDDLTTLVEVAEGDPFVLHPGEFVLASTLEVITLGDQLAGRLEGKSSLGRLGLRPRLRPGFRHPEVRKVGRLMLPTLFSSSVAQVNLIVGTAFASVLAAGSVDWLYYSDRLIEFPLGLFGVALGTVILPHLSRRHAAADPDGYSKALDWGLRLCLMIAVPACLGLMLCAEPLIATLFHYGAMTERDVVQAAAALRAYALGVMTFMLIKVLAPGFFARQDMKTPVKIAVACMVFNMIFNLILIWPLAHVGLALATSLSAALCSRSSRSPRAALHRRVHRPLQHGPVRRRGPARPALFP